MIGFDPGTTAHVARRARARRELAGQLRHAEATSADRAVSLEPRSRLEAKVLDRMLKREIIRPGTKGGYWLDVERYKDCRRQEMIFAIGALLVTAGLVACMLLYVEPHQRHRHVAETEVVFPLP